MLGSGSVLPVRSLQILVCILYKPVNFRSVGTQTEGRNIYSSFISLSLIPGLCPHKPVNNFRSVRTQTEGRTEEIF